MKLPTVLLLSRASRRPPAAALDLVAEGRVARSNLSRLVVAVVVMNSQMMWSCPPFPSLFLPRPKADLRLCTCVNLLVPFLLPPQRSRSHISPISLSFFYPLPFSFFCTIRTLFAAFLGLSIHYAIPSVHLCSAVHRIRTRCTYW